MDEVKVTIETADGQKHELTGVTAICFTIKEITKDREGNMSVCGGIVRAIEQQSVSFHPHLEGL